MFNEEDFCLESIDEKLSHLNNQEITELINRYYSKEKVNKLKEEFKINIKHQSLYKIFPTFYSDEKCIYCGTRMNYLLRSKLNEEFNDKNRYFCQECKHVPINTCDCEMCETQKAIDRAHKVTTLNEMIEANRSFVNFNTISTESRFYLSVLLRSGLDEETDYITPPVNYINELAPTQEFSLEIINTLTRENIIEPTIDFGPDYFTLSESKEASYNTLKVYYRLNPSYLNLSKDKSIDKLYLLKSLMYPDKLLFENRSCYNLWKKISYHESIRYLLHNMRKVGYDFNPGDKTKLVFESLTENFSTSQIYNIIYAAIKNSTAKYQSKEITKKHAQNLVISFCENRGERALASNWKINGYGRDWNLPSTAVSNVLFNYIIEISDLGFTEIPTKNY